VAEGLGLAVLFDEGAFPESRIVKLKISGSTIVSQIDVVCLKESARHADVEELPRHRQGDGQERASLRHGQREHESTIRRPSRGIGFLNAVSPDFLNLSSKARRLQSGMRMVVRDTGRVDASASRCATFGLARIEAGAHFAARRTRFRQ